MASWDPSKLTGLFRPKSTAKAEPPRRLSLRAMKAVDVARLQPGDVLEADEFSVGPDDGATAPPDSSAAERTRAPRDRQAEEQARTHQAQQALRQGARQSAAKKQAARDLQAEATRQVAAMAEAQRARAGRVDASVPDPRFEALLALDRAKDPGFYFVEDRDREGHSEDQEDPALREAVEECIRLLFGVRGIHHIGPGRNDEGAPVIVVAAAEGFTAESMRAVPEQVHGFPTLIALPFELVPLRRSTSAR